MITEITKDHQSHCASSLHSNDIGLFGTRIIQKQTKWCRPPDLRQSLYEHTRDVDKRDFCILSFSSVIQIKLSNNVVRKSVCSLCLSFTNFTFICFDQTSANEPCRRGRITLSTSTIYTYVYTFNTTVFCFTQCTLWTGSITDLHTDMFGHPYYSPNTRAYLNVQPILFLAKTYIEIE